MRFFPRLLQCFLFEAFRRLLQGVCKDLIGFS
jgi:hypothetical protein